MAVLRYFHQDPRQTSVQESSVIDKQGTVLTQKLTTINQSITNNTQVLEDKLNSVPGKSLSTNDFTDEYKNKLRGIEEGAEVNVQSDWGEDDNTADSYIKNKPVIDDIVTQNSENLITSGAVFTAIDELPEPMIFKGSLGTGGTIQTLPAPSADNVGFVYKVITAGTYYGITAKPGDSFISDSSDWILIPSGDEPEGTVMSVGLTVPTGLLVSGSPITTSGTLAITYALGYAIPTTAKLNEWDAKQNAISDLSTIRTNASNGNTAYGWGNHANAGYVKSSGVTSVAMTVPTGLSISGSPITSTGTLALSFANGYSIPTTAKLSNWDTAYGWGNHASAGYLTGITKAMVTNALGYTPPQQDTNTTYSAGSGLSLSGTTFSLALTKALVTTALGYTPPTQDTNTWRGITDSYSGTDSSISLSQKGGNALYNALVNGYASSAGDADLLDGQHLNYIVSAGAANNFNTSAYNGFITTANTSYDTSTAHPFNIIGGNLCTIILCLPGSASWGSLLAIGFGSRYLAYRNKQNSTTWSSWDKISAGYADNSDTVDDLHASNLVRFFLSPMTSGAPADSAKSWFTGTMPSASGAIVYNVPGSEKTIIAGKSSGSYGHMLQLSYDDTYLRILRYYAGTWKSTDWEKISAGYADSAGSVAWTNVSGRPTNLNLFTNGPGYITGITKTMVTNALGYTPPTSDTNNAVTLTNTATNAFYRVLASATADNTTRTEGARKSSDIYINPSSKTLHAKGYFFLDNLTDMWTDGTNSHPWYGIDHRYANTGVYSTTISDYFGITLRTLYGYLVILNGGNVGIGTTEPTEKLHVNGAIRASEIYDIGKKLYIQCNTDDSHVIIGAPYKSDETAGPWVGIGKVNPSYKLHVNGACGATSHPTTSDIRIKDIQSNISLNLEDIANAPLFLFKWKEGGDNLTHVGTSALYWKEKVPELVSEANDERKTLSLEYEVLGTAGSIAIAKEVVSLKEEIKLLQALIAELKLLLNN